MNSLAKIQKKVHIAYSLKHYFASASNEFSKFDYPEKIKFLRTIVENGFSTYDLSEAFRKPRKDRYTQDDMQKELVRYIAYEIYSDSEDVVVNRYYKDVPDSEVAKDLDAFLVSKDAYADFKLKIAKKFGAEL